MLINIIRINTIFFIHQKTHAGALLTRDLARQNQHRREISLLMESKEREKRLHEYRKTAEERKNYFESMERHMFTTKTSAKVSQSYPYYYQHNKKNCTYSQTCTSQFTFFSK
jgi:hypothetical protein